MRNLNALLVLALAAGCADSPGLCSHCPAIEGSYQLLCSDLSSTTPDCASLTPPAPPATIAITRNGAELHTTLNGVPARGQLTDTADFALVGTQDLGGDAGALQTLTLRGFYVSGTARDGGTPAQLQVKWGTHVERAGKFCDAERPCTATQR